MTRQFNREKAGARTKKSRMAIPSHGHDPRLNAPGWSNMHGDEGGVPDSGAADSYHDSPQSGAADDYGQENEDRINNQMPGGNLNMPETGSGNSGNMEEDGDNERKRNQEPERLSGDPAEEAEKKGQLMREKKEAGEKKGVIDKAEEKIAEFTKKVARPWQWALLSVIPSFLLSIILIDFVLLAFYSFYASLSDATRKLSPNRLEWMQIFFYSLLFIFIYVIGGYSIAYIITHPLEASWEIIKALTSMFVGLFSPSPSPEIYRH
jgi:hypothetical protein